MAGARPPHTVTARAAQAVVVVLAVLLAGAACSDERDPPIPRPWPTATALTWQWQLTGEPDVTVDTDVFALDGFTATVDAVDRLRARDKRVVCHVEAGVLRTSRPDAGRFPPQVLGEPTGRPDEWWVDVRQWGVLEPILTDRFRLCRGKGFHAVAPYGVDGYAYDPGLPLTFDDQIVFNRRLAELARSLGLSPGLVNDIDQVAALEPDFDFAVNEECFVAAECDRLLPFVAADKPVFHVEYDADTSEFCPTTRALGFASVHKSRELGVWRAPCLF
ncbi:endo alpha-1,4 polygalactosaminidase [Polymorphospora rubra]|uniref:endo alpha-1,4 polygalactosaminidase n=1 Tax=Polymorphospora rubra TaxID=338584 RepID=UPI0034044F5F